MKLTLIRHTRLQIETGICYGQSDIDVAVSFFDEATQVKTKINNMVFDAVYTSPLQRCVKLAEILNIGEIIQDNRLMELNFGNWEMQTWDDIPRDNFDAWASDYANLSPPNGESFTQLQQRGILFLQMLLNTNTSGHVAIVTHGGMIRALIAHVLNMHLKGLFRFKIDYGSVTQLEFGDAEAGDIPNVNFVNL